MKFRQSLISYAIKYGVTRASRKYNKSRSFIYFRLNRYDGTLESLAAQSKRPHHHPNEHTQAELELINRYVKRDPGIGITDLWCKLRDNGYTRCIESLFRVMKKRYNLPKQKKIKKCKPKPYEQMTHPGERVQVDVKVVPKYCYPELYKTGVRLYQYTMIDEYSRMRYLGAYDEQSTYTSADFLRRGFDYFKRRGVRIECVQTDNEFEFANRFSNSPPMRPLKYLSPKQNLSDYFLCCGVQDV